MRNFKIICFCLFTITLPGIVQAQSDNPEDNKIDLEEAVGLALENNFALKQAKNNLSAAEVTLLSNRSDYLPNITGGFSGFRQTGQQFNNATGEFGDFTINGVNTNISASYTIFDGLQRYNNIRSSSYTSDAQAENVDRVKEDIIFQTASSYLQVLLDKELLRIAEENLESSQMQLEQVQAQVEVGSVPISDLYNQQATVAQAELDVTNAKNSLRNSKVALVRQLQIDPLQDYSFETPELTEDQILPQNYELRSLVRVALENRSDLQGQEYNIQAAEHDLEAAKGTLYPTLSISGRFSTSFNDQTSQQQLVTDQNGNPIIDRNFVPVVDENGNPVGDQFILNTQPVFERVDVGLGTQFLSRNVQRNFGFNLNIPLFNTFDRRNNIQQQKIAYKNAQLELENTRLQVIQDVTQAYSDYVAVTEQLESTERALQAAEKAYETEQERYKVGAGTLIELTQAQAQFVEAESNRVQATYNFVFQEKLINYYLGNLENDLSFR